MDLSVFGYAPVKYCKCWDACIVKEIIKQDHEVQVHMPASSFLNASVATLRKACSTFVAFFCTCFKVRNVFR